MIDQAIILAGGFGTRLQTVVKDVPKPMAPINGKPFLEYLVLSLKAQGITNIVFSVGYKHEIIKQYFDSNNLGINISYSIENEPLGTGGAIKHALSYVTGDSVIVVNGDTFADLDYSAMTDIYRNNNADICLGLVNVENTERYGRVDVKDGVIERFRDKGLVGKGLINCGTYMIKKGLFDELNMPTVFSFENDLLYSKLSTLKSACYISDSYFIDIGIPEDYARAEKELVGLIANEH